MGADCRVSLPANARLQTVAKVIGAAAGCKIHRFRLETTTKRLATEVIGVHTECTTMPEMANIRIDHPTVDGEKTHFVGYHFESADGHRSMLPRSTAFWIAIMRRVVDFFGGTLDYSDSDSIDVDYSVPPRSAAENCPEDGDEYYDLQDRIAAVQPITEKEWRTCDQYAAYNIGG